MQQGLAAARVGGRHVVVADAQAPAFIVGTAFIPLNRLAFVVPLYAPGTQIDGVLDGPLLTIGADGSPHPASTGAEVSPRCSRPRSLPPTA